MTAEAPRQVRARIRQSWSRLIKAAGAGVVVFIVAWIPANPGPGLYAEDIPGAAAIPTTLWAAMLAVPIALGLWMYPRRPWFLVLSALITAAAEPVSVGLVVAAFVVATSVRERGRLLGFAVAATLAELLPGLLNVAAGGGTPDWRDLAGGMGGVTIVVYLPMIVGLWVAVRRQVTAGLRERAERLEREQAATAMRARAEERNRIARDMHDIVAHKVSLMVLHAGALEVGAVDDKTARAADLIRATGAEALAQLRDVLQVLRTDQHGDLTPQPTLHRLDELLDASRAAGVEVTLHDDDAARQLSTLTQHTVYRVVQESLTNVHKHSDGAATTVTIRRRGDDVEVVVGNAAPRLTSAAPLPGHGSGLASLRKRLELLGGTLHAGPREDGGFDVVASLPAKRPTPQETP